MIYIVTILRADVVATKFGIILSFFFFFPSMYLFLLCGHRMHSLWVSEHPPWRTHIAFKFKTVTCNISIWITVGHFYLNKGLFINKIKDLYNKTEKKNWILVKIGLLGSLGSIFSLTIRLAESWSFWTQKITFSPKIFINQWEDDTLTNQGLQQIAYRFSTRRPHVELQTDISILIFRFWHIASINYL